MSIFKAFFGLGKIPQVIKFFEFKSFDDVNKMGGAIAQIKQQVREGGLQLTQAQQKFLDDQMKQVEMVLEKIQQPIKETGIKSTQSAKILDLQGQEIPQGSKIMGGKAIKETEAEIAERLGRENKQAVGNIRKKKLRDEISKLDDKIEARKLQLEQRGVEDFETDSLFNKLDEQRNDLELKLDFEDMVDPENMAQGGRIGLKAGMSKRAFLKLMGGAGAGLAALKTGALKLLGKEATPVATEVVKSAGSGTTPPPYFFNLVKKIKNLGDDVTPNYAVKEREKVTKYKDYELTEDLTTGEQTIQKKSIEGDFDTSVPTSEEVYMNYKPGAGQMDETTGKVIDQYVEDTSYVGTSRGDKGEIIDIVDGVPDDVIEEGTIFKDNITDFSKENFKKSMKKFKKIDETIEEGDGYTKIEKITDKIQNKATGGRAGYFLGGKVGAGILKLLKNKKKVKAAYDDIFPSGDYKYDAEMVAESLVENNPKVFGNRLYEDLTDVERFEVYGAALNEASTNFAKTLQMKRALRKASKPTKTLEGIKKTGIIDISDPDIAEEFTRFMKETDPEGSKVIEQTVELSNFNPKGRKKNATGGIARMLGE